MESYLGPEFISGIPLFPPAWMIPYSSFKREVPCNVAAAGYHNKEHGGIGRTWRVSYAHSLYLCW